MVRKFSKKLIFLSLLALLLLNTFHTSVLVKAYDKNLPWAQQASQCSAVSGNIDQELDYVYLGSGSYVPPYISNTYPQASASYLEAWKSNMVGMVLTGFKSFVLSPSEGYTTGQLAGKALYFEIILLKIWNDDGSNLARTTSVVNVKYSLYINCQPLTAGTDTATTSSSSAAAIPKPNDNTVLIAGSLGVIGIGAVASFFVYNSRKPNLNTQEILEKTKTRETKNIQSLKESLGSTTEQKSTATKKSSSVRRRR